MIIVRRTYLPLPGKGGQLLALVKQAADAMAEGRVRAADRLAGLARHARGPADGAGLAGYRRL